MSQMMALLASLWGDRRNKFIVALAHDLARELEESLWALVAVRAPEMTPAEARGYIRAHSGSLVRQRINSVLHRRSLVLAPVQSQMLHQQVTDTAVDTALARALTARRQQVLRQRAA